MVLSEYKQFRKVFYMKNMMRRFLPILCTSLMILPVATPAMAHAADSADTMAPTSSAITENVIQLETSFVVAQLADQPLSLAALPVLADMHEHGTTVFGLPVNEGPIDRTIRGVIAAGLIGAGAYGLSTGNINTPVSATLLGVSAIPLLTAATGYCPLYSLFGVDYTF